MKIRSVLVSFILFFSICSYADTVKVSDIVVEGLHNVKLKNVLSVLSHKKGKIYSIDAAREDVRAISGLKCFSNVEVRFDKYKGILTFIVSEKTYIERIVFKGNVEFSNEKLKHTSVLKEKDYYDDILLEETKNKICSLYKDKGYADCEIEVYPTINVDTNKMTVTFLITENNKIVIGGVKIEGVNSFKNKKILKIMKTKPKKIFKENLFKEDLISIQKFYENNGFIDCHLVSSTDTYNESRTEMFLTLNVSEGNRYKIGSITYNGNFAVDDEEINKVIKFKTGQIFDQHKVVETVYDLSTAYSSKGYLFAEINPDFNKKRDTGIVDINLLVKENSPIYLGNVYIDGLVSTRDKVIRREILLKSGDLLSFKKVNMSIAKIYNLGFIESAEPKLLRTEAPDVVDLSFSIAESKPGMVAAGLGYSSFPSKFIGSIQLQHMNLFGLGQKLNLLWEFGKKRLNYEIDWTEPWIFNKNVSLDLRVFDFERKRDYSNIKNAYSENKVGFSTRVGPKVNDYVGLLFGYTFEHTQLTNIGNGVKYEEISNSLKYKTTSIFACCVYDSRDYKFDPSAGSIHLVNLQLAGTFLGGNVNFVKGTAKSTWFFPTFWKFVLSVNIETGVITAYEGHKKQVPIPERFYIGGPDTVRGYKYGTEIGPHNGGTVKSVMNIEYKFPIIAEKGRTVLQGVMFYDIGGVWEDLKHIDLNLGSDKKNLHSGIGFGIRFTTPAFPIRLDWGYGLNHEGKESRDQFYLNIGNVF
ncbi:MAG: outer membrane protein assembly factor BamA [Endomicrobium sp.]|jgi:outer membrane protein insertion porin family|nr:outer membrane protein assembly factor BamA [Endomicrobium sp.]